jgi:hypothetical protein
LTRDPQIIRFEIQGETRGLRIGGSTPVDGHRYVARLADDEVAYVASYRVNAFNRNLADLRDRRIFGFEDGEVRTIRIGWPSRGEAADGREAMTEVALARAKDGAWHLGAPVAGPADPETIRDVISNLTYLRVEEFVDDPDAATRMALEETAMTFYWTVEGEHLERHARVAGEHDGQRLFETAEGRVDLISSARLEDFPRRIGQYRDRRLAEFDASAARGLEMRFSERGRMDKTDLLEVTATLEESGWSGSGGDGESVAPDRISGLIRSMSNLKADDIFADAMGQRELRSLNLNPPAVVLRVMAGSDDDAPPETLATVHIGGLHPGRGYFAQRGDSPMIYLIDPNTLKEIPASADRYRKEFRVVSEPAFEDVEDAAEEAVDPLEGTEWP